VDRAELPLGVTWVAANDHAPFMNRFTVIAASGLIGLGVMGCRNDEGSSTRHGGVS
jgi:hypothetical protein